MAASTSALIQYSSLTDSTDIASPFQRSELKKSIREVINFCLRSNSETQHLAEQRRKALEVVPEYPAILLEIISNKDEPLASRQMASICLKTYFANSYNDVIFGQREKEMLFSNMALLLDLDSPVLRSNISLALIQFLASEDRPLLQYASNKLLLNLHSTSTGKILGTVELIKDMYIAGCCFVNYVVTVEFFIPLKNVLINSPKALQSQTYPTSVRAMALSCMIYLTETINETAEGFPILINELTECLAVCLTPTYTPDNDFQMKGSVIKDLCYMIDVFDDKVVPMVEKCLPTIGTITVLCFTEYRQFLLNERPLPTDPHENSAGEYFLMLVQNILNFLDIILETNNATSVLFNSRHDLMFYLIVFSCLLSDDTEVFSEQDGLDDRNRIRQQSIYTLMHLIRAHDVSVMYEDLVVVLQRVSNELDAYESTNYIYYAKLHEAIMLILGHLVQYHPRLFEVDRDNLSIMMYVERWSRKLTMEGLPQSWLIIGRLLWLGSKFSRKLSMPVLEVHMNAIMTHASCVNRQVRVACAQAIRNHLNAHYLTDKPEVIRARVGVMFHQMFSNISLTPSVVKVYLEALAYFSDYFHEPIESNMDQVVELIKNTLSLNFTDNAVMKQLNFMLSRLCKIPSVRPQLLTDLMPIIIKLLRREPPPAYCARIDAPERGIELFNTFVMYSQYALPDDILRVGVSAVTEIMLNCEAQDVNAKELSTVCMINIIMKFHDQLTTVSDNNGKYLCDLIPDVAFKFLGPQASTCSTKFGRLMVVSLIFMSQRLTPSIEAILKSVLSFLQRAKDSSTIQNLCMIFAFVFMHQPSNLLDFLTSIPGPDGGSALEYYFRKWTYTRLDNSQTFERNLLTLSICKMIEYSLSEMDNRINEVTVPHLYGVRFTGLEYLYYLLITIAHSELKQKYGPVEDSDDEFTYYDENYSEDIFTQEEDMLIKEHPIFSMNISSHLQEFFKRMNTIHYSSVVRHHIPPNMFETLRRLNVLHTNFVD